MPKKLTTLEFIEKSKVKHNNAYTYERTNYIDSSVKVVITCPKHGDFKQLPLVHTSRGKGCPKCSIEENSKRQTHTQEYFLKKLKTIHGDLYGTEKAIYVNNRTKVKLNCKKHGFFEILPASLLNKKAGCLKCHNESKKLKHTEVEEKIFEKQCK